MPELDILDAKGGLVADAVARVYAAMLFPDDSERQKKIVATNDAISRQTNGKQIPPEINIINDLDHEALRMLSERDKTELDKRSYFGFIVGSVLIELYRIKIQAPQHMAIYKAQNLISDLIPRKPIKEEGVLHKYGAGLRNIKEWWVKLKPAAALWAAYVLLPMQNRERMSPEDLIYLLAIGREMANFGLHQNGIKPILEDDTLMPPRSLNLLKIALNLPPLTNDQLEKLSQYVQDDYNP